MGCASCHHVPMTLWTCYSAASRGYEVDQAAVDTMRAYLLDENDAARVSPPENPPADRDGTQIASIYVLLALEAGPPGWSDAPIVTRTREHYAKLQNEDGTWPPFPSAGRAPILEGGGVSARMLMLALAGLPNRDTDPPVVPALEKARAWIAELPENPSHQVRALQLMANLRLGASPDVIEPQLAALTALQRPDGSWAQTPEMEGDAYATGQTLYALGLAGKRMDDPNVARAVVFLLKTQSPDGSWPMTSRPSTPEDPGAHNLEPITFAGTAWAVLGMLETNESVPSN